jgi:hypothetical protein
MNDSPFCVRFNAVPGFGTAGFQSSMPEILKTLYHESILASTNVNILTMQEDLHFGKMLAKY